MSADGSYSLTTIPQCSPGLPKSFDAQPEAVARAIRAASNAETQMT